MGAVRGCKGHAGYDLKMGNILTEEESELRSTLQKILKARFAGSVDHRIAQQKGDANSLFEENLQDLGLVEHFRSDQESVSNIFRQYIICCEEFGTALLPFCAVEYLFCQGVLPRLVPGDSKIGKVLASGTLSVAYSNSADQKQHMLSGVVRSDTSSALLILDQSACYLCDQGQALDFTESDQADFDLLCSRTNGVVAKKSCQELDNESSAAIISCLLLGFSAELYGMGYRAFSITQDYVKTREQFGVPVGGFQAVQHRIVDMYTRLEALRSLVWLSVGKFSLERSVEFLLAVRSALSLALRDTPAVVESAIQLHGGVGFTYEHELHLYLRRSRAYQSLLSGFVVSKDLIALASEQGMEDL